MKLSIEAKVAAAVAAVFAALTVVTIAQGNSSNQAAGPNTFEPATNPGMSSYMSEEGYNSSLPRRTKREGNRQPSSAEREMHSADTGKRGRIAKPRKRHTQHLGQDQQAEVHEAGD